ncbi:MAG: preprotein translocase subunit YajC [Clostridia bacterium]|nr:preprotein translocase subunit YajC [Clostridia bacterium]
MFGFTKVLAIAGANGGTTQQAAQTAGTGTGADIFATIMSFAPFLVIILLMYFVMIRPQRKKEKELREQINAMKVGDKVVTIGGLCGKVTKLKDNYVFIETGNVGTPDERSVVKFEKSAIKAIETIHAQ